MIIVEIPMVLIGTVVPFNVHFLLFEGGNPRFSVPFTEWNGIRAKKTDCSSDRVVFLIPYGKQTLDE